MSVGIADTSICSHETSPICCPVADNGFPGDCETGFPEVQWGDEKVVFHPTPPPPTPRPFAALVFPFYGDRLVLANIVGRGWCIPSGRIEPGEEADQAVRREAHEEAGIAIGLPVLLGHYRLQAPDRPARISVAYIADVQSWGTFVPTAESEGRQLVGWEELAEAYCAWDPLLSAVFERAWSERQHRLRTGTPIPADFLIP